MADIINLNKVRKERAKDADKRKAAENKAAKGQTLHAKTRLQLELEKARQALDAHKRDD